MGDRIGFPWYVGQGLASLLPYRRRRLVFGPRVCEWAAVVPMAEAAFFLSCSLALVNKPAAEAILTESAASAVTPQNQGQSWRITFSEAIGYLERGQKQNQSVDTMTFENFYPEIFSDEHKGVLLTPEQCVVRVGQWVIPGLICGVLFPDIASSMLETWVTQERKQKDLGVGGLRVTEAPLLTSVEEAYKYTQSLYEAWQRE